MPKLLLMLVFCLSTARSYAQVLIPTGLWGQKTLNVIISDAPTYAFPSASAGTTVEKTFTVSNLGLYTASQLTGTTFATPNFNFKGGAFPGTGGNCASTLPAASSCAVVVTASSAMGGLL